MKGFKRTENIYTAMFLAFVIVAFSGAVAQSQAIDTLWYEDFEDNVWDRWYVTNGSWEVGTPTSGPNSAHSGIQCAATVLDGNYLDNQDTRLIRIQSFVVPTGPNPRLRFWHFYSFNNGDYGQVQLRVVGDSVWQTLESGKYGNISGSGGYHSSNKWTRPLHDLSEFSGQTVQLSFRFKSVRVDYWNPDVSSGWYIDEVLIETGDFVIVNPEDWESGINDWYADFGIWEDGEPTSGPGQAYSGINCVGTIIDGNYYDNLNSRLISPAIVVPSDIHNPRLRFWHYYSFHNGDSGYVQIRTVGDSVWQTLENGHYEGNSGGVWVCPYFPLNNYGDETIQFAFRFKSVRVDYWNPDVSSGWYLDDISIQADTSITSIQDDPITIPTEFTLNQNYPNPFNPTTTVNYLLPTPANVRLDIYNLLGQHVATLYEGMQQAGEHIITWDASGFPSGVYFARLETAERSESIKMLFLK